MSDMDKSKSDSDEEEVPPGSRSSEKQRKLTSASPLITIEARRSLLHAKDSRAYLNAVNITTSEVVAAIELRMSKEIFSALSEKSH